jgi:hypothetical protein
VVQMKGGDVIVERSGSGGGGDSDDERGRLDEDFVRPVVRQVMSELLEESQGQLSLSQLSSRLVRDNVLTPVQARRHRSWLANEATSFLEEGPHSGGGGDSGSSEELEAPPPSVRGEADEDGEEEDVFASMSQLFNLDSSDSSETKRRAAIPLSLSQMVVELSDHEEEAGGTQGTGKRARPSRRPRRVPLSSLEGEERKEEERARTLQYVKRVRTFRRWQMDALPPVWPGSLRTTLCTGCGERWLNDCCLLELCDQCCSQDAGSGCGQHLTHTDRDCAACHNGSRLKSCPFQRCRWCCAVRPGGACRVHLREAQAADVRHMTFGRHLFAATDVDQVRRRVVELYLAWSRGDLGTVCHEVDWLSRRRGSGRTAWDYVSPLELCAFALGAAEKQPRATAEFMQNMRARCYEWLDSAQRFVSHGTPATVLLVNDVLAALAAESCSIAALESLQELHLFSMARIRALVGLAHERAAGTAANPHQEMAKALASYQAAMATEEATEPETVTAAAGLMRVHIAEGTLAAGLAVLRALCVRVACVPLLLLYTRHSGLEAGGEGEAHLHHGALRACPTWEPSLRWLCRHAAQPVTTLRALMRALLAARDRKELWKWLAELLLPRKELQKDALCVFFVEELFTYCEDSLQGDKRIVEAHLIRLLT